MHPVRRRAARWGRWLGIALVALIAALTVAAALYDAATPGGKPARSLYSGPYVRVAGRELAYRTWGTHGSPVVLIGGFIEGSDVWRRVAPLLAQTHRVYSFDVPPFGYSERKGPYVVGTWVDELEAFDRALHIVRPTLVGHSLGAAIVVGEALRRPRAVQALVLLDGDGLRAGGAPGWLAHLVVDPYYTALYRLLTGSDLVFRRGLKAAYGPAAPHFTHEEIAGWQRPFKVAGTAQAFKEMLPHGIQGYTLADLRRVHVPTIVAWGAHDTIDDVSAGRITAGALRAPFVLLPRAGHLSMLVDPAGVARVVQDAAGG